MEPFEIGATYRISRGNNPSDHYVVIYHGRSTSGQYIMEQPVGSVNYLNRRQSHVSAWKQEAIDIYKWELVPHGTLE